MTLTYVWGFKGFEKERGRFDLDSPTSRVPESLVLSMARHESPWWCRWWPIWVQHAID
jgi:hypothetical protein